MQQSHSSSGSVVAQLSDEKQRARVWLGLRLRGRRERRGLSLSDLANRTGVPAGEIHEIEAGKATPQDFSLWFPLLFNTVVD